MPDGLCCGQCGAVRGRCGAAGCLPKKKGFGEPVFGQQPVFQFLQRVREKIRCRNTKTGSADQASITTIRRPDASCKVLLSPGHNRGSVGVALFWCEWRQEVVIFVSILYKAGASRLNSASTHSFLTKKTLVWYLQPVFQASVLCRFALQLRPRRTCRCGKASEGKPEGERCPPREVSPLLQSKEK